LIAAKGIVETYIASSIAIQKAIQQIQLCV